MSYAIKLLGILNYIIIVLSIFQANNALVDLRETAGGGNPGNCKRGGGFRYSQFNGFAIARPLVGGR